MPVKNNQRPDRGANRKTGNAPKETPEQKRDRLAKELGLTRRQQSFVDELLENKGISATEAYIRIYGNKSRNSARALASQTLAKPNVQIYKDSAIRKAKTRIVGLVDSDNEQIALKAAQDIIDRTEGKAGHNEAEKSRTVKVIVDLTGVKLGNHYLPSEVVDGVI